MKLTIFTALYNRKKYLPRLYDSLKRQESNDFEWLIVDDGSTDSPEELILPWIDQEKSFPIRFFQKENGGKHTATNLALEIAAGDFFLFLDSDDYLTENAVSLIKQWILGLPADCDKEMILGVAGQKINSAGEYLLWRTSYDGRQIPYGGTPNFDTTLECTISERSDTYYMRGDCCEIFRTSIIKQYPFPVFKGERFLAEDAIYSPMSRDGWKIRYYKDPLEICEYQVQGLTYDIEKFLRNPKGWGYVIQVRNCSKEERIEREYEYFHRLFEIITWTELCENLGITDDAALRQDLLVCVKKKQRQIPDIEETLTVYDNINQQMQKLPSGSERYQTVSGILDEVTRLLSSMDMEICITASTKGITAAQSLCGKKKQALEHEQQILIS